MKKAIIILLAAAVVAAIPAIALCMAASAFDGKPGFSAGGANGAWLWMEPAMNRLHVRFSTTGNEKRFFGSICGDKMSDLIIYKVNEQPENKDAAKIAGDAHCLTFNFKAKKNLVGFYVTPDGQKIDFKVNMDDTYLTPHNIWIGSHNTNPPGNPFTMER